MTGGRVVGYCTGQDLSFTKHALVKGGGAHAEGGSAGAGVAQQNIAQEGLQNNTCNNLNFSVLTVDSGRLGVRCRNKDSSFSKHIHIKGGGARAEGGSATVGGVFQQNIAQEGQQNNNCNNLNAGSTLTVVGDRVRARCGNKDASFNRHTHTKSGGARAGGGSSTGADVRQQNIAQEGRQNNNCRNPNSLTLNATGSRSTTGCTATDRSTNIGTISR
ncbi:hypothetical protein [Streptomyces sp. NPDC051776]|uniref:hypothetical protein n=1 Tax=Streptomyces sp. NPDC051776 TaxID=3155414 RepID=UPI00342D3CE2